jgi:peptidoglycan/LPS O-acetylase OafA/YrhL
VIAFVTNEKERDFSTYVLHRCARIWSVAIPALFLAVVISIFVRVPTIPDVVQPPAGLADNIVACILNAFFWAEIWNLDIAPPLNGPFWSLNYEVWYYAIFACWIYARGMTRYLIGCSLMLICGPKIIMLFPCWLLGVWAYRYTPRIPERFAIALFGVSLAAYAVLLHFDVGSVIRASMKHAWPDFIGSLHGSNKFVGDYLLAVVVTANFMALRNLERYGAWLMHLKKPIRTAASYTFSIYLYHVPILVLLWDGLKWQSWSLIFPLCAGILLIGQFTERRLPWFRTTIAQLATGMPQSIREWRRAA